MTAPIAAIALSALAGAAGAQPADQALAEAVRPAKGPALAAQVLRPRAEQEGHALKLAGIARTAVERRLSGDDVTGSLGFLCGLQPGAERSGVAAARGVDPTGRFVGAKLRLAFR